MALNNVCFDTGAAASFRMAHHSQDHHAGGQLIARWTISLLIVYTNERRLPAFSCRGVLSGGASPNTPSRRCTGPGAGEVNRESS